MVITDHPVRIKVDALKEKESTYTDWCREFVGEFLQGKWRVNYGPYSGSVQTMTFYFKHEADATMFALRWIRTG